MTDDNGRGWLNPGRTSTAGTLRRYILGGSNTLRPDIIADNSIIERMLANEAVTSVKIQQGIVLYDANGNAVLDLTNLRIGQTMKVGNRTSTLQEDVESIGTMQLAINGKLDATVSALDEGMVLTVASDGSIVPAFPSDTCAAMTAEEVSLATSD